MSSEAESPNPPNVDPQTVLGPNVQPQSSPSGSTSSAGPPQHIYVHHITGGVQKILGRLFLIGGWLAVVVLICMVVYLRQGRSEYYDTTKGVLEQFHSGDPSADDRVAVITIR
ncbi:MAG: hypothetical protein IH991_07780, partial [Planctomycetes bacterium]|nr:hypothetical protein [Planctomycetota bacterium]